VQSYDKFSRKMDILKARIIIVGGMRMTKNITVDEIEILKGSPYVKSAYRTRVSFTSDFKREYLCRYDAGESGREILNSFGIDPEILGDSRIWSLTGKFRGELEKHGGFSDTRRKHGYSAETATIEQLRVEVAYVKQEVEFLKKNIILDLEAQRSGLRKAARTRSLNSSEA
jgi:hypothetical protein